MISVEIIIVNIPSISHNIMYPCFSLSQGRLLADGEHCLIHLFLCRLIKGEEASL